MFVIQIVNLFVITLYQAVANWYPKKLAKQCSISSGLSPLPTLIETCLLAYAFYLMQQCGGGISYQVSRKQMVI